jgi:hypothetical protein
MKIHDIVQCKVSDPPLVGDGCYRIVAMDGPFVRVAACSGYPPVRDYFWYNVYRFELAPDKLRALC